MRTWQLWLEDKAEIARRLSRGEDLDGYNSAYGDNDLIIGFLMVEGFWSVLVDTQADLLKKENGYAPRILNGLWALCELAGVGRIAQSGKVLGDGSLLRMVGFQAEEIEDARAEGRLRVDPETLSNHLARISEASVEESWGEHVKLLLSKRWNRGRVYAVDGNYITIPYGNVENYEGAGKVGDTRGYKLVALLNIEPGQERVIGWALGPLECSERTLLKKILDKLKKVLGPARDWIDVLIFDRGYWGAQFLTELKQSYGIDYVTRSGNDNLDFVKDVEGLSRLEATAWHEVDETHSHLGEIRARMAGFENVPLIDADGKQWGICQSVIADEYDRQGRPLPERPRFYYVTSLPVDPAKSDSVASVRRYYRGRWPVENQGFWVLTKRWNLDMLAGRNHNAIRARLNFVLQLYNAENCCVWKHPGSYDEEMHRLRRPAVGDRLGKPCIMLYTPDGKVGAFQANEYAKLLGTAAKETGWAQGVAEGKAQGTAEGKAQAKAEAKAEIKAELKESIYKALGEGKSIRDILNGL